MAGKFRYFGLFLFLGIIISSDIFSANKISFKKVAQFPGGETYNVEVSGNLLFTATGPLLEIWDVSDRSKPKKLSQISFNDYNIGGLYSRDNYLFVGTQGGLAVIDISNPVNPQVIGIYGNRAIGTIKIKGDYLYANSQGNFVIFDIKDIHNIKEIGKVRVPSNGDFSITEKYAYLPKKYDCGKLYIVDISDKRNPFVVKSISGGRLGFSATHVDEKRKLLFALEYRTALHVYDISNPANPVEIGKLGSGAMWTAADMKIVGNYAYFSAFYEGIRIVDVSKPENMKLVSICYDGWRPGYVADIVVKDGYAYEACEPKGFAIFDVHNPKKPKWVNSTLTHGRFDAVYFDGKYVYVNAEYEFMIFKVNTSPPYGIKHISSFEWARGGAGPKVGNYLFVSGGWRPVAIVDVSDPENPKIVKKYSNQISPGPVVGNIMYLGRGNQSRPRSSELHIIDISKLPEITVIAKHKLLEGYPYPPALSIKGNYLFAGFGNKCILKIYDVSNPVNIREICTIKTGDQIHSIAVCGDYLYVKCSNKLDVFKISNPSNPVKIKTIRYSISGLYPFLFKLYRFNKKKYLISSYLRGLVIWDITEPSNPAGPILYPLPFKSPGLIKSLDFKGDLFVIAVGYKGIYVYKFGEVDNKPPAIKDFSVKVKDYSATIHLRTDEKTICFIKYGKSPDKYNRALYDLNYSINHMFNLKNLVPDTKYYFLIEAEDLSGNKISKKGSFKTYPDKTPPEITIINPKQNESLPGGTGKVNIKIKTDENAWCQYSFSDFKYGEGKDFTEGQGTTHHSFILDLEDGRKYTVYYRCRDKYGNKNLTCVIHNFSVPAKWWDSFKDSSKVSENVRCKVGKGVKLDIPSTKIHLDKDVHISAIHSNSNFNPGGINGYGLAVGNYDRWRILIEFTLPEWAKNLSSLKLFLYRHGGLYTDYSKKIGVYLLKGSFSEEKATWIKRNQSEKWNNPGGDYLPLLIDSAKIDGNGWYCWTLVGKDAENPLDISPGDRVALLLKEITKNIRSDFFRQKEYSSNKPYIEVRLSEYSGYIISKPIKPKNIVSWDKFYADATLPEGTSITYSIIDAETGKVLCRGLTGNGDDISGSLSNIKSIKLKAELKTKKFPSTPVLYRWCVTWKSK